MISGAKTGPARYDFRGRSSQCVAHDDRIRWWVAGCNTIGAMADATDLPQTDSGIPIKRLYDASDLDGWDPAERLGAPGEPPYTRGVYGSMYTGRLWTMRQYSGFGNAEATNERFKFLLNAGQTGLSCAFDLPTQMGYDSDHGRAEGEVGKVGVAIDSMEDMRLLLAGLPLDKVSTSMTINSTAAILLLMYELVAEENGVSSDQIGGTIQNDLLKEYIARGTYVYPPRPSMRIITDIFEYCSKHVPNWNTISISGYHIREAGSTAVQEIAFTLANAIAYVQAAIDAGPRRRRLRATPQLLLERAQQLLRRGRQVPRQPEDVAHDHDRTLRREGSEVGDAALPHADRRIHTHRTATDEQRHACDAAGTRCGDGWNPEPAHQRLRRGAEPAHRRGGAHGAAYPAGHRLRVGGRRHARPARRVVLRRVAHR